MALGVIKIIPASSHAEFSLTGGGTAGGGNPYPSASVLNPNDGVAYVAQNRDCIGVGYGAWDWKVPSQSYALLPGPFTSMGVYYLDQSGAGRQGEITIYPSQRQFDVPLFNSIGRALQTQTTSLDITEGAQPPAPSIGVARVWSDNNGLLWRLLSTGQNDEVVTAPILNPFSVAPAADVVMSAANTFYVACSVSLPPGTYLIIGAVLMDSTVINAFDLYGFDSTNNATVLSASGYGAVANAAVSLSSVTIYVVPGNVNATIQLGGLISNAGGTIRRLSHVVGAGGCTRLVALRIA